MKCDLKGSKYMLRKLIPVCSFHFSDRLRDIGVILSRHNENKSKVQKVKKKKTYLIDPLT